MAQGEYRAVFGDFSTLNHVKFAHYRTHYVNNDDRQMKIDNRYRQSEFYFSTANEYAICPWWQASLSYDFQWNMMDADVYDFARPDRFTNMLSLATAVSRGGFRAQTSVLATMIHDRLEGRRSPADKHVLTPAVFASYDLCRDLTLRAFYKQSYRMPTFNDLYYADMGNARLDPERVTQYNLGGAFEHRFDGIVSSVRMNVDAYYNHVKDKIIAYPKGQQFRWTMLNLGSVDIHGVDVAAQATFVPVRSLELNIRGQYTFQRAIDVTDPADSYYRHQIPYIPRHSGSAVVNASWRRWNLNYSFIYVGSRYNQQENIAYNYTQPWYTSDLSLSRDLTFGKVGLRVMLEVNNLLSQDYDVILNYPMPKRNYRFTINVEL